MLNGKSLSIHMHNTDCKGGVNLNNIWQWKSELNSGFWFLDKKHIFFVNFKDVKNVDSRWENILILHFLFKSWKKKFPQQSLHGQKCLLRSNPHQSSRYTKFMELDTLGIRYFFSCPWSLILRIIPGKLLQIQGKS